MSTIDIQFNKKIDNSRIERETDSLCGLEYISLTLLGAVFVLGALFYGWQQYQWIQYGYRIEEAQRQIEEIAEVGRQLKVERALYASPQRIDQMARDLGMVGPDADQIVTLGPRHGVPDDSSQPGGVETQLAQRTNN